MFPKLHATWFPSNGTKVHVRVLRNPLGAWELLDWFRWWLSQRFLRRDEKVSLSPSASRCRTWLEIGNVRFLGCCHVAASSSQMTESHHKAEPATRRSPFGWRLSLGEQCFRLCCFTVWFPSFTQSLSSYDWLISRMTWTWQIVCDMKGCMLSNVSSREMPPSLFFEVPATVAEHPPWKM